VTDRMSVAILWIALIISIVLNVAQNRQLAEYGDVTMQMIETNEKAGESFESLYIMYRKCADELRANWNTGDKS